MAKLRTLKPLVSTMKPRLGYATGNERERDKHRVSAEPWRKWYRIARWSKLRMQIFVRDMFTCQICRRIEPNTSQLVCDHIEPHHGNEHLFWDDANLQCLCKTCHDSAKQKQERSYR